MLLRFSIAAVLLLLLGGGIVGFNLFRDQMIEQIFAEGGADAQPVDAEEVEAGPWQPALSAFGTISAERGVILVLEAEGRILDVTFEGNQHVSEGDLLVRVDSDMERADLRAAEAEARLAEQTLERRRALGETGTTAEATVEEAEATLEAALAQVERLEATIRRTELRAPFDGEIGIPNVEPGQFANPGMEVASLQRTDAMRVDFNLTEQQVARVEAGQTVELIDTGLNPTPDTPVQARITAIEPRTDPETRLVAVRAVIDAPEGMLRRGQFVRLRVLLDEETDVIAVPETAVIASLFGDYVYAVRESEDDAADHELEVRQVFVETGERDNGRIRIHDGLEPGDRVVVAGQNRLSNRAPVTMDEDEAREAAEAEASL